MSGAKPRYRADLNPALHYREDMRCNAALSRVRFDSLEDGQPGANRLENDVIREALAGDHRASTVRTSVPGGVPYFQTEAAWSPGAKASTDRAAVDANRQRGEDR